MVAAEARLTVAAAVTAAARAQLELAEEREAEIKRDIDSAVGFAATVEPWLDECVLRPPASDMTLLLPDSVMASIFELVQLRIASEDRCHCPAGCKTLQMAVPAVSTPSPRPHDHPFSCIVPGAGSLPHHHHLVSARLPEVQAARSALSRCPRHSRAARAALVSLLAPSEATASGVQAAFNQRSGT